MTPEQIRKTIEDFPQLLTRQERIQNRLINLAGRDPEQEAILFQRLEQLDMLIDPIDHALDSDSILTDREHFVVSSRIRGLTYEEIGEAFPLSRERVRQILVSAYKKIAATNENIA